MTEEIQRSLGRIEKGQEAILDNVRRINGRLDKVEDKVQTNSKKIHGYGIIGGGILGAVVFLQDKIRSIFGI